MKLAIVLLVVASCICHGMAFVHEDEWEEDLAPKPGCTGARCTSQNPDGTLHKCRSQWGSCGSSSAHCNSKSQWSQKLCGSAPGTTATPAKPAGPAAAGCLTAADVANAWVATVGALPDAQKPNFQSQFTPQSFCAAALAVAHGESYDTPRCPGRLDSKATNAGGVVRGLWQFSKNLFKEGMTASQQAKIVITMYTSNNQAYGCKAPWQKTCTAIALPGLMNSCSNSHVFCNNVWTGQREVNADHYRKFVTTAKVNELCAAALSKQPPAKPPPQAPPKPPAKPPKTKGKRKGKRGKRG